MELGSYFLFLQEQIKDIIIIITRPRRALRRFPLGGIFPNLLPFETIWDWK